MYYADQVDDVLYGQATDDGFYDDVETYDETGTPASSNGANVQMLAVAYVALALVSLWVMGAAIFKGSNQS